MVESSLCKDGSELSSLCLAPSFLVLRTYERLSCYSGLKMAHGLDAKCPLLVSSLAPASGMILKAIEDSRSEILWRESFSGGRLWSFVAWPCPLSSLLSASGLHLLCDEPSRVPATTARLPHTIMSSILKFLLLIYLVTATRKWTNTPTFYQHLSTVIWCSRRF